MKITVTKAEIESGHRHDPERCPVAQALNRAGILHFGVMLASVVVADGNGHVAGLALPAKVTDWILDFDSSRPVGPISFELTVPWSASEKLLAVSPDDDAALSSATERPRNGFRQPDSAHLCGSNRIGSSWFAPRRLCAPGLRKYRRSQKTASLVVSI